jgi:hypothetical protein
MCSTWTAAAPRLLWQARRITREGRRELGEVRIDARLLEQCGCDELAVLMDRCSPGKAARILCGVAEKLRRGVIWVVAGNTTAYARVKETAQSWVSRGIWRCDHLVYDAHPRFMDVTAWNASHVRILLTSNASLLDRGSKSPRRRHDILRTFTPFVAVIDPYLTMCSSRWGFDPAWAVRDLVARLRAAQRIVPLVLFTEREAVSINTRKARTSFGIEGLIYLDGGCRSSTCAQTG